VRAVTQAPDQQTFTFSTRTVAYFVLATPAFPGWTANLDGHPTAIQQIAGVLPAIKVGPGTYTMRYIYAPSSVRLGTMLSVVGLLVALAWLIAGRRFKPGYANTDEILAVPAALRKIAPTLKGRSSM